MSDPMAMQLVDELGQALQNLADYCGTDVRGRVTIDAGEDSLDIDKVFKPREEASV